MGLSRNKSAALAVRCGVSRPHDHGRHESTAAQTDIVGTHRAGREGWRRIRRFWHFPNWRHCFHQIRAAAGPLAKTLQATFFVGAISASLINIPELHTIGINERIKGEGIACTEYAPTKSSYVFRRVWQRIKISSPTPEVEKFCSILNVENILWSERRMRHVRSLPSWAYHFWSHHSRPGRSVWINRVKIESLGYWQITEKAVAIQSQLPRWRIAAILPDGTYPPIEMASNYVGFEKSPNSSRKNEGPFIGNEGLSGEFSLPTSGKPERSRESGNDDCGKRGDCRIISSEHPEGAADVVIDRDLEGGWIFFGGAGIFILVVGGYALLECRRKNPFRHEKNRQDRDKRNQ